MIKCSGLGGRKRHGCIQNKLLRQNQVSPGEGAAPSASSPPSVRSALASDDGASGRISASKVVASTALGPGRVKPLDFGQGSFIFVRKAIPLVDPL
jgi:hypothetical protein